MTVGQMRARNTLDGLPIDRSTWRMGTNFRRVLWVGLMVGFALTTACGNKQNRPLVASSAQQGSYAVRYPDELEAAIKEFNEREEEARAVLADVPNFSDALENPDWGEVLQVVDAAVMAGRAQAYSDRIREARHVHTFYDEEKDEINRRAAGAAQYAANQAGCDAQVGGAVGASINKSVDKQLKKRLRERNEAHLLIVRHRESLGDKNAKTLGEQADHLSYLSFITWVELTETKRRVETMVKEADEVQETANAFIAQEEEFQKEADRSEAEKKSSAARVTAMKAAQSRVASVAKSGKKSAEQMKERIEKLQKEVDYVVGAYRAEVAQRADE